jgi:hypothetical protein
MPAAYPASITIRKNRLLTLAVPERRDFTIEAGQAAPKQSSIAVSRIFAALILFHP